MNYSNALLRQDLAKEEAVCLLEIVNNCASCATQEEFEGIVEKLKGLVPFEYFTAIYSCLDHNGMCEPYYLLNVSFPMEWLEVYVEKNYQLIDPVLRENFTNFKLQYWADTYQNHQTYNEFISNAEEFGLKSGYTSGMKNHAGNRGGLISLAGKNIARSDRHNAIIELVTPHLYQALERVLHQNRQGAKPKLSTREIEVLKWFSHHKTKEEISAIMNIGDRTVVFHINNILKKLHAVSRRHAAAIGLELGIIEME